MSHFLSLIGASALALAVSAAPSLAGSQPVATTDLTSDTGGLPTFSQVNGYKSMVKVKHVGCGEDCWTHGLATKNGNLNLKGKMGFACPAGDFVDQIYYTVGNSGVLWAYKYAGVQADALQSRVVDVTLQPWTPAMFEGAAISALGSSWSGGENNRHNARNTATIAMHQDVVVFATCAEDQTTRHKAFKVNTTATIIDLE